ncbi:MAG TPA: hypothetical protein VN883_01930 [Myxococcales bacterium]|jgi:uncharacterized RDD family membrane protein YckC|nr:hypothetical protein [Myxococcales bacterium]
MLQAEPPGTRYPPADLRRRALARALDFLLAFSPLVLVPATRVTAGLMLSAALLLCGDRLFGPGRSLGKRFAGLRCIVLSTRRPAGLAASLRRNGLFAFALLPAFLGARPRLLWTLSLLCAASLLELAVILRPLTRDLGQRRLGDLVAGTQVIDASLAVGLPAPGQPAPHPTASLASRAALDTVVTPPLAEEPECASP